MLSSSITSDAPALPVLHTRTTERVPATESDRRAHQRLAAAELPGIHARLKYGPIVTLVDLSAGGAQIETANHQLQPGAPLVVQIVGRDRWLAVPAQVLRCHISALGEHPTYRGALEFRRRVELEQLLRAGRANSAELHRLDALTRAGVDADRSSGSVDEVQSEPWTVITADGLNAARAMIEAVASRRGPDRARSMGILLKTATPLFERGMSRRALVSAVLECIRSLIPGATIRLIDPGQLAAVSHREAFYVDVPRAADRPARRLLIEFVGGGQLEPGHLELLRMAAHLVAVADDKDRVSASLAPASADAAPQPASAPLPSATPTPAPSSSQAQWRKLIVRYRDGRLLKGHSRGFQPSSGQVHVWAVPDGPAASRVTVPLSHLKALFFVHEFEGRAALPAGDAKPRAEQLRGRPVTITFLDGEALTGTTLTYSAEGPGFFVLPQDESSNNEQIFVVNGAVRHMQFA